jgi:hypothetical protein
MTFFDDGSQSFTVIGILGDRFAEIPRLPCPIIYDDGKVMGSDSTSYCRPTRLHCFDGSPRCSVFENDAEPRECMVKLEQVRKKLNFGVKNVYILVVVGREFGNNCARCSRF